MQARIHYFGRFHLNGFHSRISSWRVWRNTGIKLPTSFDFVMGLVRYLKYWIGWQRSFVQDPIPVCCLIAKLPFGITSVLSFAIDLSNITSHVTSTAAALLYLYKSLFCFFFSFFYLLRENREMNCI